jgi:hypothetical protein
MQLAGQRRIGAFGAPVVIGASDGLGTRRTGDSARPFKRWMRPPSSSIAMSGGRSQRQRRIALVIFRNSLRLVMLCPRNRTPPIRPASNCRITSSKRGSAAELPWKPIMIIWPIIRGMSPGSSIGFALARVQQTRAATSTAAAIQ